MPKYIFPGGHVPSVRETVTPFPDHGFQLLDVENLRRHYALTLDRWTENFTCNCDEVRRIFADRTARLDGRWDGALDAEKFVRTWRLYLEGSAACFHAGSLGVHQFLVSKGVRDDLPLTRRSRRPEPPPAQGRG